jgi:hypothetical protein
MRTALRVFLVLILCCAAAGCSRPKAVSSSMSQKEQDGLRAALDRLEDVLKTNSPFVAAKLLPPATKEELATLQAELGGAQVQTLEIWYGWHNGCQGSLTDLIPLGRMLSIAEAIDDRQMEQTIPFIDAKRRNSLKILPDAAGDGFFLDITSPTPRVYYHMLEDPSYEDFGTLEQLVNFIADVHAAGLASLNEHGMVAFDLDRYHEMETKYRAGLVRSE